ncbi:MAG: EamA family transporter [Candidatus Dormibacteraeota bacterium]|nr:EamA family transporter [Candidatus Dormibacteraeota bacterium]
MTAAIAGLVLLSAVFHAGWNILLKTSADPLRLSARAIPLATLVVTPFVVAAWLWTGRPGLRWQAFPIVLASGATELAYFACLSRAYRRGDISSVYPVARGTAPVLAVAIGLALLGERLDTWQVAGVLALLAGIWLARPPRTDRAALPPALLVGACIAIYTALDRVGVRLGPAWLYSWLIFVSMSLFLLPFRGRARMAHEVPVGLLSLAAYSLILLALSLAPLALVAPLRESGVVLVALWGVLGLGERRSAGYKVAGAGAVLAGASLIALG